MSKPPLVIWSFSLTQAEAQVIDAAAAKAGLSRSGFIRSAALHVAKGGKEEEPPEIVAVVEVGTGPIRRPQSWVIEGTPRDRYIHDIFRRALAGRRNRLS